METFIRILSWWLVLMGSFSTILLVFGLIDGLSCEIKKIMKRQSKIRFLCQHKYKFYWKWFFNDYTEQRYRCTKCGKVLKINVVEEEVE